jgi:hypothetical protein
LIDECLWPLCEGIGMAGQQEDVRGALQLGEEVFYFGRLLLHGLGGEEGAGKPAELILPPEELRLAFGFLQKRAAKAQMIEQCQTTEVCEEAEPFEERNRLVLEACKEVSASLESPEALTV